MVFGLGPATKIYIAVKGVDMRKGVWAGARPTGVRDPLSGDSFLFANRANSRLNVLLWDGSGLSLCAKRLEKGRFRWPAAQEGNSIVMRFEELDAGQWAGFGRSAAAQELVAARASSFKHLCQFMYESRASSFASAGRSREGT